MSLQCHAIQKLSTYIAGTEMNIQKQTDPTILSSKKTDPAILFLHIVMHHSPFNHVRPKSRATNLGHLLHTRFHVITKHTSCTRIIPLHRPIPTIREHNVRNQIQCHDFRVIPIG